MSRRLDWDKAKADQLKGMPSEPADVDMINEPEHQEWWRRKSLNQRAVSKKALEKQMADAFSRGDPLVAPRPKIVVDALISPKIKALIAEMALAKRRREERFSQALLRGKARTKPAKRRG